MSTPIKWVPVSALAREYQKHPFTIRRWITSGFIFTLGYRVRRDVTGHWRIGIPA